MSIGGKDISLSGQGLDRPYDVLPTQVYGGPANDPHYWLNPAAFMCAGSNAACTVFSGQFGNVGRNAVYGPGQINFDMALTRRFTVGERWKLDPALRLLQHHESRQLERPGTNITSGTFGESRRSARPDSSS